VLRAAIEKFAAKGFAATTTRELASELGFTKATLYYYFPTKEDILLALLVPVAEGLEQLVEEANPLAPLNAAQRRQLLAGFVDFHFTHGRAVRVLFSDPSSHVPDLVKVTQPLYERILVLVTGKEEPSLGDLVRARVALGGIREAQRFRMFESDIEHVKNAALVAACGAVGIPGPRGAATLLARVDATPAAVG
jgi:AcrR family transcriptional regulator